MNRTKVARFVFLLLGCGILMYLSWYFRNVLQTEFWTNFFVIMVTWIVMYRVMDSNFPFKKTQPPFDDDMKFTG